MPEIPEEPLYIQVPSQEAEPEPEENDNDIPVTQGTHPRVKPMSVVIIKEGSYDIPG